ncbi:uncharacterized protein METZ01_LOCUS14128 [marine metagenome]|uniref:Uncharacterized protein n=1 Tax=marine metagenome TaxID=408172 RepID=A0A381P3Y9_9ZZZZ
MVVIKKIQSMMLSHPDWLCTIHAQSSVICDLLERPAS